MMSSASASASAPIKPFKINSENVFILLQKVLRKFTAIKKVTYFEELTDLLSDDFILSLISTGFSGENLYVKLKRSKFAKKFHWLNKAEPKSGFLFFIQVGSQKEQAILIHLSKLKNETSEVRLFSKYKDDFNLLPKNFMDFLEKIICIYKGKHSNAIHHNLSNKSVLYPKNKETMKTVTSLQYSIYLVILFLSDRASPSKFSEHYPAPSLTRNEYWIFCKEVNFLMADCEKRKTNQSPLPQSKRTNRTNVAQPYSSQNNVGTQTWSLEPTSSLNRKLQQDLHFAHIEIRKLQQENQQLKIQLSNNHYKPF